MDRARPTALHHSRNDLVLLMSAIANDDRSALAELYRRTSAKLYGICLRTLNSETEAEEALQDVYVTVWRKAGLYDGDKASAITWLAVVARNQCLDRLRRKRIAIAPIEAADEVPSESDSAFEVIERAEDRRHLVMCLDELEDAQRGYINSAFMEGLTYTELALQNEVPVGTMKSWIRRGLLRLRGCLER